MFWMVFFVSPSGRITRTGELSSYDVALDASSTGIPGSFFQISRFGPDPGQQDLILEGYVA